MVISLYPDLLPKYIQDNWSSAQRPDQKIPTQAATQALAEENLRMKYVITPPLLCLRKVPTFWRQCQWYWRWCHPLVLLFVVDAVSLGGSRPLFAIIVTRLWGCSVGTGIATTQMGPWANTILIIGGWGAPPPLLR